MTIRVPNLAACGKGNGDGTCLLHAKNVHIRHKGWIRHLLDITKAGITTVRCEWRWYDADQEVEELSPPVSLSSKNKIMHRNVASMDRVLWKGQRVNQGQ